VVPDLTATVTYFGVGAGRRRASRKPLSPSGLGDSVKDLLAGIAVVAGGCVGAVLLLLFALLWLAVYAVVAASPLLVVVLLVRWLW